MYLAPVKYKCETCGFEMTHSQSNDEKLPIPNPGAPFCPKCLIEFIAENVPQMKAIK